MLIKLARWEVWFRLPVMSDKFLNQNSMQLISYMINHLVNLFWHCYVVRIHYPQVSSPKFFFNTSLFDTSLMIDNSQGTVTSRYCKIRLWWRRLIFVTWEVTCLACRFKLLRNTASWIFLCQNSYQYTSRRRAVHENIMETRIW